MVRYMRPKKSKPTTTASFSRHSYAKTKPAPKRDIQEIIWEESRQSSDVTVDSDLDTINALVDAWQRKRACVFGKPERIQGHSCSKECLEGGQLSVISAEHRLYGCIESGNHHLCRRDMSCGSYITNKDSVMVCIFSKEMIEVVMDATQFGGSEKNRYSHGDPDQNDGDLGDYDLGGTADGDMDADDYESGSFHDSLGDEFDQELERFLMEPEKDKDDDSDSEKESKSILSNKRKLPEDPTEELSSAELALLKKAKKRKCFAANNPSMVTEAKAIIKDLLYNANTRVNINKKKRAVLHMIASNAVRQHYKMCNKARVMPTIQEIDEVYDKKYNTKMLLRILDDDPKKVDRLANACCALWSWMLHTPYFERNSSKFHPKEHVMGTLYVMRMGQMDPDSTLQLLPEDKFLFENLPPHADLKDVKPSIKEMNAYKKREITKGTNNIKGAINSVGRERHKELAEKISRILKS